MANQKISALTSLTGATVEMAADVVAIVDTSLTTTKKITIEELKKAFATTTSYINDTANASATMGLTINQGTADDEILALKSSDVSHGVTGSTETDTYALFKKTSADSGGLLIEGYSESTVGAQINAIAPTDTTTKATTSAARLLLDCYSVTGTTKDAPGVDANLVAIRSNGTTRFIFDTEGSAHADVEWTTFDKYDDIALLNGLDMEMQQRQGVQGAFNAWVAESKDVLQREGIVNFYDDGPRAMVNLTKMHMLEVGAIRQLGRVIDGLMERVRDLEGRLLEAK